MANWRDAAPYCPTPLPILDQLLTLAAIQADELVVDLGSGDGRFLIEAARRYGARGRGVERSADLVAEARANAVAAGVADRVEFEVGDLYDADFSDADLVFIYLNDEAALELLPRFLVGLARNARLVSHDYALRPWVEVRVIVGDFDEKVPITAETHTSMHLYNAPSGDPPRTVVLASCLEPANEALLLLACARTWADDRLDARRRELLAGDIDWLWLVRAGQHHGLLPLLRWHLADVDDGTVPVGVRNELANWSVINTARGDWIVQWFATIAATLAPLGIWPAMDRGPAFAAKVHGGAGLRQFGDLDLLVVEESVVEANAAIDAAMLSHVDPIGRVHVAALDLNEVVETVMFEDRTIAGLAAAPLLVRTCREGASVGWSRLGDVVDVADIVARCDDIDWEWAFAHAATHGHATALAIGLALAVRVLDAPLPDDVIARLREERDAIALVRDLALPDLGLDS